MAKIVEKANLQEAFLRAARGKFGKKEVIDFRNNLDQRLENILHELLEGSYQFGDYHFFIIYDPKKRKICAASFSHRVVFHAMMRICHPVFDSAQIFDSYASRIGKGQYKALERARQFCRKNVWFAKLDVCKYFDSIDHTIMLGQLSRLFKDMQLLTYFQELLASYEVNPGKGLPIGNLTSQYFANHYLSQCDHYAKEVLHVRSMIRYMDDVLLFADDRQSLVDMVDNYLAHAKKTLKIDYHPPVINKVIYGVPFLGYVVYPDKMRLSSRSRKRFIDKIQGLDADYWIRGCKEKDVAQRASCLFAFVDKADCFQFKLKQYHVGRYS